MNPLLSSIQAQFWRGQNVLPKTSLVRWVRELFNEVVLVPNFGGGHAGGIWRVLASGDRVSTNQAAPRVEILITWRGLFGAELPPVGRFLCVPHLPKVNRPVDLLVSKFWLTGRQGTDRRKT